MRILLVGDPKWYAPELAEAVVNRLILRYGPSLTIVHGAGRGMDRAFAGTCSDVGIEQEAHPPRWRDLDHPDSKLRHDKRKVPYNAKAASIRGAEMVAAGAGMCLVLHRSIRQSREPRNCAMLAIKAGIPTYLIEDESATPRRVRIEDLL